MAESKAKSATKSALAASLQGTGIGRVVVGMLNLKVRTEGVDAMGTLWGWLGKLRERFVNLGVTAIFLDRLFLTLRRTWDALDEAIGATRVSEQARQFSDFAQMLGLSVENFQAFSVGARVFGANLNDVVDMFSQMQERVNDYRHGVKGVVELMQGTGVSAGAFKGKDPIERFQLLAKAIQGVDSEKGIGILQSFFGEEGQRQFGPWAAKGPQAVAAAMQEVIDVGAVMTKEQVAMAREYSMQRNRMNMFFTALGNNFALMVMPALREVMIFISEITGRLSKFFQSAGGSVSNQLLQGVRAVLDTLRQGIAWIDTNVMPFEELLVNLGHGMLLFTAALAGLANAPQALGLMWFLKVALALSFILQDIAVYLRGGDSIFEDMLKEGPGLQSLLLTFTATFEQISGLLSDLGALFSTVMQSFTGFIALKTVVSLIGAAFLFVRIVIKSVTAAFLIFETVLLSITWLIAIVLKIVTDLVDFLAGTNWGKDINKLVHGAGVGAIESLINVGRVVTLQNGDRFGGFAPSQMFESAFGRTAHDLMYRQNMAPFTQINNINIPTTATAESTSNELDKWIASQRKAAFESTQRAGGRR